MRRYQNDQTVEENYRRTLKNIDGELVSRDLKTLKFLLRDVIPLSKLEKSQRGIHLFNILEDKEKLGAGNVTLLAECLFLAQRLDLVNQLTGLTRQQFEAELDVRGRQLLPYRVKLHHLAEDLTDNDLEELKFLMKPDMRSTRQLKTPYDLFLALEQNGLINAKDTSYLDRKLGLDQGTEAVPMTIAPLSPQQNALLPTELTGPYQETGDNEPYSIGATLEKQPDAISSRSYLDPEPELLKRLDFSTPTLGNVTGNLTSVVSKDVPMSAPSPEGSDRGQRGGGTVPMDYHYQTFCEQNQVPPMPSYKMDSQPRGICLIINNKTFDSQTNHASANMMAAPGGDPAVREGTDVDADQLGNIFSWLGFSVKKYVDCTADHILQLLQGIGESSHSDHNCFICCILSHGIKDHVCGTDWTPVKLRDLMSCVQNENCPSLKGKPKLFFIQACQCAGVVTPQEIESNVGALPNESDFLLGYASVPGFAAYRNVAGGSPYINSLVKMLQKYGRTTDLLSILTMVNEDVRAFMEDVSTAGQKLSQCPAPHLTLTRRICF